MTIAQGARFDVADHREAGGIGAGEEGDHVVEQPDLRLVEEGPEVADHRRRQHHRQHDDRGPQIVAAEFLVDQVGQREADQHLEEDRPEQEMRRRLHRVPDTRVVQDGVVIVQPDPFDRAVGPVGAEVRQAQPDRPDQREDVDRQQQRDGRRHEYPGDGAVRQSADPARQTAGPGLGDGRSRLVGHECVVLDLGLAGTWQQRPRAEAGPARPVAHAGAVWWLGSGPRRGPASAHILPSSLKVAVQSSTSPSSACLRGAVPGDDIVVEPLLAVLQQRRVARLGPEVLDDRHRVEEGLGIGLAGDEVRVLDHRLQAGIAAKLPPLRLNLGLGEPLDVVERRILVLGIGDDRNALPAQLRELIAVGPCRIGEIAGLVAADIGVGVEAGPGEGKVHLHRHLTGFEGVDAFAHVAVGRARRGAAIVKRLVELQPLHRPGRVDEALHVIGLVGVLVFEAEAVEDIHRPHGDPFRAALGIDRGAVDLLAVDLAALEEFGDVLQFGEGRRRRQIAAVFGLELGLDLGLREPVLAVGPADHIAHRRQRPVVRRVLRPFRIADHRRRDEIVHLDAVLVEEVVQLDVLAVLGGAADPLAVADHQVAQMAARVQLVQEAVGKARPGHELEFHVDPGLGGEVLRQLDQRIRRVPGGPAQGQILRLRRARPPPPSSPLPGRRREEALCASQSLP